MPELTFYKGVVWEFFISRGHSYAPMILCQDSLYTLLELPRNINTIFLVGLKRAGVDTFLIAPYMEGDIYTRKGKVSDYALNIDGEAYTMNRNMCILLLDWISRGYKHVRVEY